MFEKVNPMHPDKIADRIAGAIVDLAYKKVNNPRVACEVLVGHGRCFIINETSVHLEKDEVNNIVKRITQMNDIEVIYNEHKQDSILAKNQTTLHCGDNGIFKGVRVSSEEKYLTNIVKCFYDKCAYDGKYIICDDEIIACQSNCEKLPIETKKFNPLGYWTGGINVDSGATNRKLGSDMGRAVTGGGLHGKDLSKADVSVNIYLHLLANDFDDMPVYTAVCAIGDEKVKIYNAYGVKTEEVEYDKIVEKASEYVRSIGGFEKLAEWGLIR